MGAMGREGRDKIGVGGVWLIDKRGSKSHSAVYKNLDCAGSKGQETKS